MIKVTTLIIIFTPVTAGLIDKGSYTHDHFHFLLFNPLTAMLVIVITPLMAVLIVKDYKTHGHVIQLTAVLIDKDYQIHGHITPNHDSAH